MLLGAASAELGFAFATLSRARRPARRRRPAERSPGAPAVPPTTEGTAPRVLQRCVRSHGLSNVRGGGLAARRTHGRISSTRAWRTGPSSISIVVGTSYAARTSNPSRGA